MMKISRAEGCIILLAALFLGFSGGWFFRGAALAQPLRVETQYRLEGDSALALPDGAETPRAEKLNINTATAEELTALPGIGEKRAAAIVADRELNGPFRFPEDLTRVSGIGDETVKALLDYIMTEEETP